MKTETRLRILKLIEEKGKLRPVELRAVLKISGQALHRHLRSLTAEGLLELRGAAPRTFYVRAGEPDFEDASTWIENPVVSGHAGSFVCETREVFTARLPRLQSFLKNGLASALLPLVLATAGEVGNNSFDHNLGQWRDIPGCWFEPQATGRQLWICIGDRGQGVFHSLHKVHPHLADEQSALRAAFETIISGRAPEQRGNGLKFVRKTIETTPGAGLACVSGGGRVSYGEQGDRCAAVMSKRFGAVTGTVTLMVWRLQ